MTIRFQRLLLILFSLIFLKSSWVSTPNGVESLHPTLIIMLFSIALICSKFLSISNLDLERFTYFARAISVKA